MSTYESMEVFGMAIDTLDNLIGALQLPMPAQFHIEQLKRELPELSKRLKEVYKTETGDDPWA